jgi:hypothetical protein
MTEQQWQDIRTLIEKAVTEARVDELERLLAVPESSKIVKEDEALFAIHGVRGGVGKTDSVRVLTPKEVIEHRIAES